MKKDWFGYLLDHAVIALKLDPDGESGQPVLLWKEKDFVAEVPSLVGIGSRIYMVMNGGILICIDIKTGDVLFNGRLGAPGSYLSSSSSELILFDNSQNSFDPNLKSL